MVLHTSSKGHTSAKSLSLQSAHFLASKVHCDWSIFSTNIYSRLKSKISVASFVPFLTASSSHKRCFSENLTLLSLWNLTSRWLRWPNEYSCYFIYSRPQLHCVFSSLVEAPWASSRETTDNVFWQRILAKSGVFCHRWDNHSHIDKNVGKTKRSK